MGPNRRSELHVRVEHASFAALKGKAAALVGQNEVVEPDLVLGVLGAQVLSDGASQAANI